MTMKRRSSARGAVRRRHPVTIRRAAARDGEAFLSLVDALAAYEKLPGPAPAARRRLLRDAFGPKRRFDLLIARSGGRAVGYAVLFETYSTFAGRPTLFLEDLFVLPELRGRGVGRKLFRRCAAEGRKRGCGRMEWIVLDWNRPAIGFYRRLGAHPLKGWIPYRLALQ